MIIERLIQILTREESSFLFRNDNYMEARAILYGLIQSEDWNVNSEQNVVELLSTSSPPSVLPVLLRENRKRFMTHVKTGLEDYFGLTTQEADHALQLWQLELGLAEETAERNGNNMEENDSSTEEEDDDGEWIGEGECQLCERDIKLTRHHLIPRSTWPRLESRLNNAAHAIAEGKEMEARIILGEGMVHLLGSLASDRKTIRTVLKTTCDICRPCHSMIHRTHDNMTLANEYNTVEKLLQDSKIYNFCRWANKQKAGKHSRRYP